MVGEFLLCDTLLLLIIAFCSDHVLKALLSFITSNEVQTFEQVQRVCWGFEETSSGSRVKYSSWCWEQSALQRVLNTARRKSSAKIAACSQICYSIFRVTCFPPQRTYVVIFPSAPKRGKLNPKMLSKLRTIKPLHRLFMCFLWGRQPTKKHTRHPFIQIGTI